MNEAAVTESETQRSTQSVRSLSCCSFSFSLLAGVSLGLSSAAALITSPHLPEKEEREPTLGAQDRSNSFRERERKKEGEIVIKLQQPLEASSPVHAYSPYERERETWELLPKSRVIAG